MYLSGDCVQLSDKWWDPSESDRCWWSWSKWW